MHVKGNIDSEKKELNSSHVLALTAEHGHFIQRSWCSSYIFLLWVWNRFRQFSA